ncbi:hypothetical protein RGR602_PC00511 (plasmid) [Rhizobium gallicum bv. gallicum R602sp]|uniref:Uncharacterized protein n=1 Tax=Rhizobium gallicum bv. gallicum R602sp TaxID=1041138 RepID=A0A0B4XBT6_9HYPH|nr:hypothetical protein RGR602_PC00511 [Rhizobium gallicum bv. gallicum R602sp]
MLCSEHPALGGFGFLAWWTHQISLSERGVSPPFSPIMPIAPAIPVQQLIIEGLRRDEIKE